VQMTEDFDVVKEYTVTINNWHQNQHTV
jgi:hypothetical protein